MFTVLIVILKISSKLNWKAIFKISILLQYVGLRLGGNQEKTDKERALPCSISVTVTFSLLISHFTFFKKHEKSHSSVIRVRRACLNARYINIQLALRLSDSQIYHAFGLVYFNILLGYVHENLPLLSHIKNSHFCNYLMD